MNSNGVLNSNRFVEKLGIQMLLRNVVIYMLLFTHHYPARCFGMNMQILLERYAYSEISGTSILI